jgi:ubiquinone/menaquinone biosynthesis C-methylase UbiE
MKRDKNLEVYSRRDVVNEYAAAQGLQGAEEYAFEKYIRRCDAILDIGVGGGRTTPYLSARASRYVGIDFSSGMVQACRQRFPTLEFHHADASDLSLFRNADFDVVVFSFNGIDNISTNEARARCLREVQRVLRPGGHFIFSSHNARGVLVWPDFRGATLTRACWRMARSAVKTIGRARHRIFTSAFRRGIGYVIDPVHGGLVTLLSTPRAIKPELEATGFVVAETVGSAHPRKAPAWASPWHYYVLTKL